MYIKFAKAFLPTPIFNHFALEEFLGQKEGALSLNQKGRLSFLEMIALKGTLFVLEEKISTYVYRVSLNEYKTLYPLYVDIRSLENVENRLERELQLPLPEKILDSLLAQRGRPYLWGGNLMEPIEHLEKWYCSKEPLSPYEVMMIRFDGVDCSGLIYSATLGFTPRNTSEMVHFGRSVSLKEALNPLDLIVDFGHVVIVIDQTWSIQSKEKFGVFLLKTTEVLDSLQRRKKWVDQWESSRKEEIFTIRRFL
jgi:hypothetical protein